MLNKVISRPWREPAFTIWKKVNFLANPSNYRDLETDDVHKHKAESLIFVLMDEELSFVRIWDSPLGEALRYKMIELDRQIEAELLS